MLKKLKKIPYGNAEFGRIRNENMYYVDKTHFIPLIEESTDYIFFIRPRRFGKSLFLSVLQYYYDINDKDRFDDIFRETYIVKNPTKERNTFLIMTFNFASVNPDMRYVEESFEENGKTIINDFLTRYERFFDDKEKQEICSRPRTEHKLGEIFIKIAAKNLKLYIFIDEYDNFANTILSSSGRESYEKLTHDEGFFRFFFNMLKTATSTKGSGLTKLFVTGVSSITMDDVTSGMNIGSNISMDLVFNESVGFTEQEVCTLLKYYFNDSNCYLEILKEWYGGYVFSIDAEKQLFNSDMILYFINEFRKVNKLPRNMIDNNIRIDYSKLRHLILVDQKFNGNFSRLQEIINKNQIQSTINLSFPLKELIAPNNFISLLYFFGLLTIRHDMGETLILGIPNLTVKKLIYSYLRDALNDADIFRLDIWRFNKLIHEMANAGKWQPVFEFIDSEIQKQSSVRNFLEGERTIQMFLLAYLNISNYYITQTEQEMNKGYADLFLEPFMAKFPHMKFGYLIEMKHISKSKFNEKVLNQAISDAKKQLQQYSDDAHLKQISAAYTLKKIVLVYKGWELMHCSEF
ncbi:hypothetical protein MHK_006694 [Candidatus Magnetomorum sp. HK-1]|nr:hypothetical protein MHK_006694 [Candidatus Magnetomorum sp. HK-1]